MAKRKSVPINPEDISDEDITGMTAEQVKAELRRVKKW